MLVTVGDHTPRVWEAATGRKVAELLGHTNFVTTAAFSPDGRLVVTGGWDGTARVWEPATGRSVAELRGHTDRVSSLRFSPDGKSIVTASDDKTACIWESATGKLLRALIGHTGAVLHAEFSPDSELVVTASEDGTARLWESSTGQSVAQLLGHRAGVSEAVFSHDGTLVATASHDGTGRVWNVAVQLERDKLVGDRRIQAFGNQFAGKWTAARKGPVTVSSESDRKPRLIDEIMKRWTVSTSPETARQIQQRAARVHARALLASAGKSEKLGPRWNPSNPWWRKAEDLLVRGEDDSERLAIQEARAALQDVRQNLRGVEEIELQRYVAYLNSDLGKKVTQTNELSVVTLKLFQAATFAPPDWLKLDPEAVALGQELKAIRESLPPRDLLDQQAKNYSFPEVDRIKSAFSQASSREMAARVVELVHEVKTQVGEYIRAFKRSEGSVD